MFPLQTSAAHLTFNIARQLFPRWGGYRQGISHVRRIQLLAQHARVAGTAHDQHITVIHST
ncbi:hypothetical protein D3C81_2042700 [compost metagenome]